ncbi:MAG TPA: helix-turn-helix transcriptional regulator [Roseiflexaceae bacterium]|nr:helix-turn-helix transcriptional regulator [Roseiflexaceae bacterium]
MLRLRQGLSQDAFAEQLGYSTHAIIALLDAGKRNPTIEWVIKLSDMFNLTADQLIRDHLDIEDASPKASRDGRVEGC